MSESQSSYKQIMKATSLFGGVQIFQIIINILRSKLLAVLLGPAGMGYNSILNSTISLIASMTNFGLSTSAVKNVAAAYASSDHKRVSTVVSVLRKLVWVTGLLGALLIILFSPWLSEITFGHRKSTAAFCWIAITLFLNQISNGQNVLLRGTRRLKQMAAASLTGSVLGLLISVPMYYKWGIDGVVPAIIGTSIISLLVSWHYSRTIKIEKVVLSREETISEAKSMLAMGFMLSMSGLLSVGSDFFMRSYITKAGGVEHLGLYSAGFAIINSYVGMIFTAMSADYYPRLSGVAHDNMKAKILINQQAEIAVLLIVPILLVLMIFIPFFVQLLYSSKFLPIVEMMRWAMLGLILKASSWSVGFIYLAKGDSRIFFVKEIFSVSYLIGCSILFYNYFGLTGLGIGFLAAYVLNQIQTLFLSYYLYKFKFTKDFVIILLVNITLATSVFLLMNQSSNQIAFYAAILLLIVTILYSYRELNKRLDIKSVIQSLIRKFRK
ncbi:O-antigen translocase [Chryseobacterium sp. VAUSW3]|nr:O-antigen translocase [Chryseobacterium sp. VAUSW3]